MLSYTEERSADRERTEEQTDRHRAAEDGEMRVELWREPTQTGGQNEFDRVAERLRALSESGVVDKTAVETWDRFADVSGGYPDDDVARKTLERLGRLQRWAWRHSNDLSVPTESQVAGRGRMGPPVRVRRVPRAALVEFEDGVVTNITLADEQTGCLSKRLERINERERAVTEERDDEEKSRERLRF